ncbi:hypothetical protein HDU67_005514 [Dinochytrium kinnereticum]|nr:hypothetical protein HDU67_005514 [Dinochytrium kinnereticum]
MTSEVHVVTIESTNGSIIDAPGGDIKKAPQPETNSTMRSASIPSGMTVNWTNVGYSVPTPESKKGKGPEKVILNNMTGAAEPGQIIAIMGGSGAGKSTFLNVLAGRVGAGTLTGHITVNGEPRDRSSWRKISAYVEQQEVMFKNLTVIETLSYGAQLRLSSTTPKEQKAKRVDDIIQELGLLKCKDTKIGDSDLKGISGGEKKRVSIGLELLSQPSILFLDEPTSGLDAFTAVNIISTVSRIAKTRNASVLMTIHQPRTDIHFLDVVTLDQRTKDLLEESSRRIEKFARAWDQEKDITAMSPAIKYQRPSQPNKGRRIFGNSRYNSSWTTQFSTLLGRNMKEVFRDPGSLGASIGQAIFIFLIRLDLSQAGIQNRLGALFFIVVNQTFGVVMPMIGSIPLQRLIILRERASGCYCASASFLAKWVSSLPLTIAGASALALPIYWLIGFQSNVRNFFTFYCIVVVHSFSANAMGTMLGSAVKNFTIGQILGPLFITVFLIFGGSFLNLDSAPVVFRWIQWISIISYSNKALAQNELNGLNFTCPPQGQCLTDGSAVIRNFALGTPGIWPCIFINLGLGQTSKPLLRLE